MFTPIQDAAQLPAVGEATERFFLDFKRIYEKKPFPDAKKDRFDHREMAKDVAAFANASGGTILIGAIEDQATGVIAKYEPLAKKVAKEIAGAFDQAVDDRCSPRPVFDVLIIGHGGGCIVAVNVWPFPGQPVGVMVKVDPDTDGSGEPAHVFPVRVGKHTTYMLPEQLPMMIDAKVRRVAILLSTIPTGTTVRVEYGNRPPDEMKLVGVRPLENVVHLKFKDGATEVDRMLALDQFRTVWKDRDRWRVWYEGRE
jgi:hypothetical protein